MNSLLKSKTFTVYEKYYVFNTILNNSKEKKTRTECHDRLVNLTQNIIDKYLISDDIRELMDDKLTSSICNCYSSVAITAPELFNTVNFKFSKGIENEKEVTIGCIFIDIRIPKCAVGSKLITPSTTESTWYMDNLIRHLKDDMILSDLKDTILKYLVSVYDVRNFGGIKIFGNTWKYYHPKPFDNIKTWSAFEKQFPEYIDILLEGDNTKIAADLWIQSHTTERDISIESKLLKLEELLK